MDRDSRVPKFDGSDYAYWKTRMRAYLKGKGADIWEIVNATSYPTSSAVQSNHDANNKAMDILLSSLSRNEFDRVCDLEIAHKIWSRLQSFHEGTNAVKARLFETYRREYENFVQLPGESVETLFSQFQSCVNKMRDNIIKMPYEDHDLALKLLHDCPLPEPSGGHHGSAGFGRSIAAMFAVSRATKSEGYYQAA